MTKRVLFHCVSIVIVSLSLTSCLHYYYSPNGQNVPLFQEEKEIRASAALSAGDISKGVEIQSAYAVTNHVGIMLNGYYCKAENYSSSTGYLGGDNGWVEFMQVEAGGGFFQPLGKNLVLEAYGGIGGGSVRNNYDFQHLSHGYFSKVFFQPSIGVTNQGVDFAFSTRFAGLNYHKVTYDKEMYYIDHDHIDHIQQQRFYSLIEPAFTFRVGWEYVKMQFQLGYSANRTNKDLFQENINANMGIYVSIADKFKRD